VAVAGGSPRGRSARVPASPVIRGHEFIQLCRDIAIGEKTDAQLKRAYSLSPAQIQQFAFDNADGIAEIANAIKRSTDIAMSGLWVTKKQARMAELEADIDDINNAIKELRGDDGTVPWQIVLGKEFQNTIRTKQALLRTVADEIDGPRRQVLIPEDERKIVRYVIDGVDNISDQLT